MSHNLDDPEFWLPPLFLSDFNKNDFLVSESDSGFSSPVDSSTETESDEDEFLIELTRRLSNSTHLSHDIWKSKPNNGLLPDEKADTMPTPPQSTLYNEELGKTTKLEQDTRSSGYIHFGAPPQKVSIVGSNSNKNAYNSNKRIFCRPLEQNGKGNGRALDLSPSAWPALQQSQYHKQPLPVPWTSAAAVLIPKRQCTGTGVFLPRPVATQTPHPVAFKQRNVSTQSQQRRVISRSPATMNNIEIRLPQEWTY